MTEDIILQTEGALDHAYAIAGTLDDWRDQIARYAVGNSRLLLALSAAFAGTLLDPLGAEGGGFHFRGGTSCGKTTALKAAASVWGYAGFLRTWRATSNGLESVAAMHSDTLLLLDELGQTNAAEASSTAYMLANGQGKTRAGRTGGSRMPVRWRVIFLSNGELSLADKIAEDGKGGKMMGGQALRVLDIQADAGCGLGIFETAHGMGAGELARHLADAAKRHYGHASHAWLQALVNDREGFAKRAEIHRTAFCKSVWLPGDDGQIERAAARFGLVAAAGELASELGITGWPKGEASRGVAACYEAWLEAHGGPGPVEDRTALSQVRGFIEKHGSSRFEPIGVLAQEFETMAGKTTINRVGFKRSAGAGTEFLILPESWKSEVCAGLDPKAAAKAVLAAKALKPGEGNQLQRKERLPGLGSVRCYVVSSSILEAA
jgi:uncharacterized protein (DUF927 family)